MNSKGMVRKDSGFTSHRCISFTSWALMDPEKQVFRKLLV